MCVCVKGGGGLEEEGDIYRAGIFLHLTSAICTALGYWHQTGSSSSSEWETDKFLIEHTHLVLVEAAYQHLKNRFVYAFTLKNTLNLEIKLQNNIGLYSHFPV